MKKFIVKLLEPVLLLLLLAGILAVVVLNYFAYLQFTAMNIMNLVVGSMMIVLQLASLIVFAGIVLLAADALKKYLTGKEAVDASCCQEEIAE